MGDNRNPIVERAWNTYLEAQVGPPEVRTAYEQLKPTERVFVDEYVVTNDPRGAAIAAFRDANSGHPRAARSPEPRALEMMRKPLVQAAIAERMKAVMDRLDISAERVLSEVAKIAFANMGDYIRVTGAGETVTDFSEVNKDQLAAVSEIVVEEYTEGRGEDAEQVKRNKFKLHDKLSALDKLMRYHGLYKEDNKREMTVNGKIVNTNVNVNMTAQEAAELYAASLEDSE